MKKIAVLPTLLTLGNGICGFVAITFASKIPVADANANANDVNFAWAGWFLLLAMLCDMLDGYVARLTKTASEFGGELDSLCDVVSFGVAPAFLLLKLGPSGASPFLHQVLAGIAALYFACTALRLARFNVENDPDPANHKRFKGLPSPGAAGCLAGLAILRGEFASEQTATWLGFEQPAIHEIVVRVVEVLSPVCALVVALLMVSNVPYPHATSKIFRGKKHIGHLIQVLLAALILLMFRSLAPLLVFWIYAFIFPLRSLFLRNLRAEPSQAMPTSDEHASHKL